MNVFKKIISVFVITGKYFTLSFKKDCDLDLLKKKWSNEIIALFNLKVEVLGLPNNSEVPCILVGNHISYLDIPLIMNYVPEVSFVSKKEVGCWPIIGRAAKRFKTIFVDRSDSVARKKAKKQIASALVKENKKVVIFPSGTTSILKSSHWKKGAFDIAEKNKILIQPFRFSYRPLSSVSYVGKDHFLFHMLKLLKLSEIRVVLEFHEPVLVNNSLDECSHWKNWCESLF